MQSSYVLKNYKYFTLKPQSSINFIQQIFIEYYYHIPGIKLGDMNTISTQNRDSMETGNKK